MSRHVDLDFGVSGYGRRAKGLVPAERAGLLERRLRGPNSRARELQERFLIELMGGTDLEDLVADPRDRNTGATSTPRSR